MKLKQTPLYETCLNSGARMVPFAGWEMPVQFSGVINEHQAVRQKAGIFDISHMGVLSLEGAQVKRALQKLVPTDLDRIGPGEACYTVLLNEEGGIIDDLIVYDLGAKDDKKDTLLIVLNAACFETDLDWLNKHLEPEEVNIQNAKENKVLIALQGPNALKLLNQFSKESLDQIPRFGHKQITFNNLGGRDSIQSLVAKTGYTGEEGFEILVPEEIGKKLWVDLLELGVQPCGLGARDTLRLEAAMHLYGQDMNIETTPFEAGLGWLVHLEIPTNFIGRNALEKQVKNKPNRRLVGLMLESRVIARTGYKVKAEGKTIGQITSGSWSPTLEKAIGMAYVPMSHSKPGTLLEVEIRNTSHPAMVVKRPFYSRT